MIASGQLNASVITNELNLSSSQLYTKIKPMVKVGLIDKNEGGLCLSKLGEIVFQAQVQIENAISKYWELKAIDSIEDVPLIDMQEAIEIMKRLDLEKQKNPFFRD
jgi:predicted transcriptional regulator